MKKKIKIRKRISKTKPYIEVDYDKVRALAGRGLKKEHIARCLGMSPTTLFRNQKEDESFKEAMDEGRAQAIAAVTGELMGHIQRKSLAAVIFWLKTQAGWKETSVIENIVDPFLPPDGATPEEIEAAYFANMASALK